MDKSYRDIRYVKLHFVLRLLEDTMMPKNKNSALRGGMGEMLLRANCIRDRNCEKCDFESECIVRRTMYSKMEIQPGFMSDGDSVGYVIECNDHREQYSRGDTLKFRLTLFGKTIVYFSQYINAFYALGREGIGKNHSRYDIIAVENSKGHQILNGMDVNMSNYQVETLGSYIDYRKRYIQYEGTQTIDFYSPLTLKYQGRFIQEFQIDAVLEALKRRIYILMCFEGIDSDMDTWRIENIPQMLLEEHHFVSVKRHSNRKRDDILLKGIEGNMLIDDIDEKLIDILIAGEITHIGKNTSFGFGGYRINDGGSIS